MGRTEGRTPEITRRLILDAATRVVRRDGLAATLDDIAVAAGVSKGGLVYHFRSKHELLLAVGERLTSAFRAKVMGLVDDADASTGRLTRAYIRASFDGSEDAATLRDTVALAAHLLSDPDLQAAADTDGAQWRADLDADGLPRSTVRLIIAATDGAVTSTLWGALLQDDDLRHLETELIALTRTTPAAEDQAVADEP